MNEFKIQPDCIYFIDTNIWLYAFISSQDKEKTSVSRNIIKKCEIAISTQVINEICVNLLKKANFSEETIVSLIGSLYQRNTVVELFHDILILASDIRNKHNFSFWDSLIAASALESNADYLISEDMQHGFVLGDRLEIQNPFL